LFCINAAPVIPAGKQGCKLLGDLPFILQEHSKILFLDVIERVGYARKCSRGYNSGILRRLEICNVGINTEKKPVIVGSSPVKFYA
jgi:hypothetical protein